MSYSFLLVSWGASGNLNPMLTAGRQLRSSGHEVRIMADPAMLSEIGNEFAFVPWRRAPIGAEADPADLSNPKDWMRKVLFDPAYAYALDVFDEIKRQPTDAVLCLDVLFGAMVGAEAAGLPYIIVSPHISFRPLPGYPPVISGLKQPETETERSEVKAMALQLEELLNEFLPSINDTRRSLGIDAIDHIFRLFDDAGRYLLAISQAFDFKADAMPPNMRYVGPLLDMPSWSKPWRAPWPESSNRQRVLIACSTGAQGQVALVQKIIDAAGTIDIDAVVTTGPNLSASDLRPSQNVHLLHSAPHDRVMDEVSVVISQGGHGTICRGLMKGLPLLVLPLARDQADNAARVEAYGAGLRLSPDAPTHEIAAAIEKLVGEPLYRVAARSLGDAITSEMAACSLVREVETVMVERHGRRDL